MKKYITYLAILSMVYLLSSCSYNYYVKEGNNYFQHQHYNDAVKNYKKALTYKEDPSVIRNLAATYEKMDKHKDALECYKKIVTKNDAIPSDYLEYAKLLMSDVQYDEAVVWIEKYLKINPNDLIAKILLASSKSANELYESKAMYNLTELEFENDEHGIQNMFSPVMQGNKLYFIADKKVSGKDSYAWTGNSYLDLYFTIKDLNGKWMSPEILKGAINGHFHEGPISFTSDGNVMYMTRSDYKKKKALHANENDHSHLIILIANMQPDSSWKIISEFPYNNENYSVGHPTVSEDNQRLYFISDMPGGYGGTDLYYCQWNGTGWGQPINLGSTINTSGNEMFPYLHQDGTLFFSSDGHNTMGGLDVYMSWQDGDKWYTPENLNYPLNSSSDDFGFFMNDDNITGFITSNRSGADKINLFEKKNPEFWLNGLAKNKTSNEPVSNIIVEITDMETKAVIHAVSDNDGKFRVKLEKDKDYKLLCTKIGCFTRSDGISTKGKVTSEEFFANFVVEEIQLFKPIVIDDIFYDVNKWNIKTESAMALDKLVKLLKDNPEISVEIGSHTDSRAGDKYNLILSDKRAKEVVNYLVYKGIDRNRLSHKGYGETQLVNKCKNEVSCTESEHQQNRRTEFKIIRVDPQKLKNEVKEVPVGQK